MKNGAIHPSLKGASKIMSIARITNVSSRFALSFVIFAALIYGPRPAFAQTTDSSGEQAQEAHSVSGTSPSSDQAPERQQQPSTQSAICGVKHLGQCLKDIGHDQAGIWTSPLRIAPRDVFWLVPFAAGTGVALHYDAQAQQNLGFDKSRIDTSNIVSGFGSPYATLGGAAGLYFLGLGTHNEHLSETGRLGAEAIVDSLLVVEALKLATNRERPNEGNGQGGFWPHGTRSYSLDSSFPSGHAAESFALARVIASEYPSKPVQVAAYAFALAISASRVTARQHFPSDVLVGGTFGYLIGGYVIRHHAAENVDSGFSFVPVVDVSTHTFGANIALRPDQLDLAKIGRFVNWMRPHLNSEHKEERERMDAWTR
jgi:membrane-associated phospholipid phosphatase